MVACQLTIGPAENGIMEIEGGGNVVPQDLTFYEFIPPNVSEGYKSIRDQDSWRVLPVP